MSLDFLTDGAVAIVGQTSDWDALFHAVVHELEDGVAGSRYPRCVELHAGLVPISHVAQAKKELRHIAKAFEARGPSPIRIGDIEHPTPPGARNRAECFVNSSGQFLLQEILKVLAQAQKARSAAHLSHIAPPPDPNANVDLLGHDWGKPYPARAVGEFLVTLERGQTEPRRFETLWKGMSNELGDSWWEYRHVRCAPAPSLDHTTTRQVKIGVDAKHASSERAHSELKNAISYCLTRGCSVCTLDGSEVTRDTIRDCIERATGRAV